MFKIRLLDDISLNHDLVDSILNHLESLDKTLNPDFYTYSNSSHCLNDVSTVVKSSFEIVTYYNVSNSPIYLDFLVSNDLMKILYVKDFESILNSFGNFVLNLDLKNKMYLVSIKN